MCVFKGYENTKQTFIHQEKNQCSEKKEKTETINKVIGLYLSLKTNSKQRNGQIYIFLRPRGKKFLCWDLFENANFGYC